MSENLTPEEQQGAKMATELFEALRETVKQHFGSQITPYELQIVMGGIAGLAGFYLSPMPPTAVLNFGTDVMGYWIQSRERGAATVVQHTEN
jgi:hypothetical protein